MKIEDLQVTAQLAHLNMGEKELAAAFPAFEQMLGFFAAMEAADKDPAAFADGATDTTAAPQMTGMTRTVLADHFRSDTPPKVETLVSEPLINNAGDKDGRFIVVPNVL
ncbi:Asp-tRNA(Asn)/Glu-tRNA(Gln) amidotransferase subunit GatC [Treponema primitia]|uniref:Asp-tRNA(Asn)/Glu-tRNA(Gln) amidotransferase subunit GatC n=1 Tax=Treponema primitia TaxID=88058 RepID=UPI0002555321|nr:Asp-tRNA(Asn)/Glu-tRNA(Gln) amidotransferase subunit GatC [Treponema primitia]